MRHSMGRTESDGSKSFLHLRLFGLPSLWSSHLCYSYASLCWPAVFLNYSALFLRNQIINRNVKRTIICVYDDLLVFCKLHGIVEFVHSPVFKQIFKLQSAAHSFCPNCFWELKRMNCCSDYMSAVPLTSLRSCRLKFEVSFSFFFRFECMSLVTSTCKLQVEIWGFVVW